jgi:hypothetical protein
MQHMLDFCYFKLLGSLWKILLECSRHTSMVPQVDLIHDASNHSSSMSEKEHECMDACFYMTLEHALTCANAHRQAILKKFPHSNPMLVRACIVSPVKTLAF